jgi:hypothetical protein
LEIILVLLKKPLGVRVALEVAKVVVRVVLVAVKAAVLVALVVPADVVEAVLDRHPEIRRVCISDCSVYFNLSSFCLLLFFIS